VIYDMGGKFDKSFNQAAFDGAERWKKESGKPYLEFEISNPAQREQAKRRMAERGATPIVGIGFAQGSSMEKVAKEFPKLQFAIIDSVVKLPNVQSIVFKEHEGSFLVGMMAAMASKTGKVGFVGGMDIPLIRKFQCGFEQGAKYANPKVEVSANMTGTTPTAWNDPARGAELAKAQFAKGVDVIFAAAGGTGVGVYQAAKDAGKLAIGVDSNQNHLHPGTMLTSMVKRVDVAVYNAFKGTTPGVTVLGLKEGGVDYALDEHNARLVSADMKKKVDAAKADIIGRQDRLHGHRLHGRRQTTVQVKGAPRGTVPGLFLACEGRRAWRARPGGPAASAALLGMTAAVSPPAVQMCGIDKRFGAVQANRAVDLTVPKGTIHGIVGENGAGKSTLMSILYGFYEADGGSIAIDGRPARSRAAATPSRAASAWCTSTSCWSTRSVRAGQHHARRRAALAARQGARRWCASGSNR
jgi:basic membrane protein A